LLGERGLTKGGPDGRYRRARPQGRGDPEGAGRVLRQGPSQSVAEGPGGHCGRLGPQSATATRRARRMDRWLVRRVASLTDRTISGSGSLTGRREADRPWIRRDLLGQVERVRHAREVRRPRAVRELRRGVGRCTRRDSEGESALSPVVSRVGILDQGRALSLGVPHGRSQAAGPLGVCGQAGVDEPWGMGRRPVSVSRWVPMVA
jgi:hypothetical protein